MKWWHIIGLVVLGYALGIFVPGPGAKIKDAVSGAVGG